jgi:hypothetical protein
MLANKKDFFDRRFRTDYLTYIQHMREVGFIKHFHVCKLQFRDRIVRL